MKRVTTILAGIFFFLATIVSNTSLAKEKNINNMPFDVDDIPVVINIYEVTLNLPHPSWIGGMLKLEDIFKKSKTYRDEKENSFILEYIPYNESFDSWNRLYAVLGLYLPDNRMNLSKYIELFDKQLSYMCGKENFYIQKISEEKSAKTYLFICEKIANPLPQHKKNDGEVGLVKVINYENTYLRIYEEWKGNAFKVKDKSSWPVAQNELEEMKRRFDRIKYSGQVP